MSAKFAKAQWLVCYDVTDPRRLARVFKCLRGHGIPIQKSVFLVDASQAQMAALAQRLAELIDATQDRLNAYRLLAHGQHVIMGEPLVHADVWLV